jgi:hypothetical protein
MIKMNADAKAPANTEFENALEECLKATISAGFTISRSLSDTIIKNMDVLIYNGEEFGKLVAQHRETVLRTIELSRRYEETRKSRRLAEAKKLEEATAKAYQLGYATGVKDRNEKASRA